MPTPILRIPVDDEAFKSFLKTFRKYQDQLRDQPEMWKGVNEEVAAFATASAAVAAEIEHQVEGTKKLTEQEAEREKAKQEAAKRKRDEDRDQEQRDHDTARRRRHAIEQVKEYGRALADASVKMAKWAAIDVGLGLATGGFGFWGLDRLAGGVGEERRLSSGLNVSMGQRQGMALNMQRYFDVNSVLENIANAQASPDQWAVFKMMGVNPQGKNPANLASEMAVAARRMFIADKGNLALAGAQGLTQIFSPDELRRMANTPGAEFHKQIAQASKFQGLSDTVGRKWQDFTTTMETAGLKVKNTLINKLTLLEPNLEVLITKFGDLAIQVLDRIDWKVLGDGLDTFTKYITSKQFQEDFRAFVDDVSYFAHKAVSVLRFLDLLPDPGNPNDPNRAGSSTRSGSSGVPEEVPNWGERVASRILGVNAKYTKNEAYVESQLQKWGWTPNQAAGVSSNLYSESGYNPFAVGDNGQAYGLAQWHKDRQDTYKRLFGHSMQSVTDRGQALKEQLAFLQWELTHTFKKAGDELKRQRSAYGAGYVVSRDYERPAGGAATAAFRGGSATTIKVKVENQTGSSVSTTVNSAAGG